MVTEPLHKFGCVFHWGRIHS